MDTNLNLKAKLAHLTGVRRWRISIMRTFLKLSIFAILVCCSGRAAVFKTLECYDKVVAEGVKVLVLPTQMEALFNATNVDHFITDFTTFTNDTEWQSVAYVWGRYMISMSIPIVVDHTKCTIVRARGPADVVINEVVGVSLSEAGTAATKFEGQWRFSQKQWAKLVEKGGDWSVLQIPIITNKPVRGFRLFEKGERAPRRRPKGNADQASGKTNAIKSESRP